MAGAAFGRQSLPGPGLRPARRRGSAANAAPAFLPSALSLKNPPRLEPRGKCCKDN